MEVETRGARSLETPSPATLTPAAAGWLPAPSALCSSLLIAPSQDHSLQAGRHVHPPSRDVSAKSKAFEKRNRSRTIQIWSVLRLQYPNDEFKQREKKKKPPLINLQEYLWFYNMMECSSECLKALRISWCTGKTFENYKLKCNRSFLKLAGGNWVAIQKCNSKEVNQKEQSNQNHPGRKSSQTLSSTTTSSR